jgi:protein O-mannosyl-transferase
MTNHSADNDPHHVLGKRAQPRDDALPIFGVGIFLVAIIWIVFGQTLHHKFLNFDDGLYVYQNPIVLAGLTLKGIRWAFTFAEIGHWHPVTWISHMLDVRVWGLRSGGHHLTNVLLHMAAAILLFLALKQMTGSLWRSAAVAALFAIHPQRVESVAWIAERKDVLSGFFFMATLLAYVRYVARAGVMQYLSVLVLFALGLMSKNMLVTLPVVLLLLDYWPLARFNHNSFKRLAIEKVPLLVLSAGSCIMTLLSPEKVPPIFLTSLGSRIENALVSYLIYIKQMLYPVGLELPYFNPPGGFPIWEVIAAFVLLLGTSLTAFLCRNRFPYFTVGWFWYLIMMLPVIDLVQMSYSVRADRYTYLTHIGLYLIIVWGAVDLTGHWRRRELLSTAGLVLIALLVMQARVQTSYWHDSEKLWRYVVGLAPDNFIARVNLGLVLDERGEADAAIAQFEKARQVRPDYVEACNGLGNALKHAGRTTEAIAEFRKALELAPDLPQVHNNLAAVLAQTGQLAEAIVHFRKVVEDNPDLAAGHTNLGYTLMLQGNLDQALTELQRALALKSDSFETLMHLGDLFVMRGLPAQGMTYYGKACELRPNDPDARRKFDEAVSATR